MLLVPAGASYGCSLTHHFLPLFCLFASITIYITIDLKRASNLQWFQPQSLCVTTGNLQSYNYLTLPPYYLCVCYSPCIFNRENHWQYHIFTHSVITLVQLTLLRFSCSTSLPHHSPHSSANGYLFHCNSDILL